MSDQEILRNLLSHKPTLQVDWAVFLDRFSNLILKVIWQHERDYDEVMEKYLYVCGKIAENDVARLRRFRLSRPDGTGEPSPSFTTWLAAVTQNLCIDAHRSVHGRRQLPRAIMRLPELDREIFRLYYWRGYSFEEIEQTLGPQELGSISVADSIERIREVVTVGSPEDPRPLQVHLEENDPRLARTEESDLEEMLEWLERWMESLCPQEQMILRLRFCEDLTGPEIASAMNISPGHKVYPLIQNALTSLRTMAGQTYGTGKHGRNIRVTRAKQ